MSYIFQIKYIGSNMIQRRCLITITTSSSTVSLVVMPLHLHSSRTSFQRSSSMHETTRSRKKYALAAWFSPEKGFLSCQQRLWWHAQAERSWINDLNAIYSFDFFNLWLFDLWDSQKVEKSHMFRYILLMYGWAGQPTPDCARLLLFFPRAVHLSFKIIVSVRSEVDRTLAGWRINQNWAATTCQQRTITRRDLAIFMNPVALPKFTSSTIHLWFHKWIYRTRAE